MPFENATPRRLPNVHPVEVLETEFMRHAGLSWNDLALKTALPGWTVNGLIGYKQPITPGIAEALAKVFGTSAEFWLGLQADYDAERARRA